VIIRKINLNLVPKPEQSRGDVTGKLAKNEQKICILLNEE
jgi:hypothetical protein